jgi:hypothetical protein
MSLPPKALEGRIEAKIDTLEDVVKRQVDREKKVKTKLV